MLILLADVFTWENLNKCSDGADVVNRMYKKYNRNRNKLMTVSRNRRRDNELLGHDCEDDLLNNKLDKVFKFLKQTRKYHEYKRRDGSIISQIRKEDGTVTTLEEEVHENIIRNLKLIQTCPMQPQYEDSYCSPVCLT